MAVSVDLVSNTIKLTQMVTSGGALVDADGAVNVEVQRNGVQLQAPTAATSASTGIYTFDFDTTGVQPGVLKFVFTWGQSTVAKTEYKQVRLG